MKAVCVTPVPWQVIKLRAMLSVGIALIVEMAVTIASIVAQKRVMRRNNNE